MQIRNSTKSSCFQPQRLSAPSQARFLHLSGWTKHVFLSSLSMCIYGALSSHKNTRFQTYCYFQMLKFQRLVFHSAGRSLDIKTFKLADIGEGIAEAEILKWFSPHIHVSCIEIHFLSSDSSSNMSS
jgi:hypothetical protein